MLLYSLLPLRDHLSFLNSPNVRDITHLFLIFVYLFETNSDLIRLDLDPICE